MAIVCCAGLAGQACSLDPGAIEEVAGSAEKEGELQGFES